MILMRHINILASHANYRINGIGEAHDGEKKGSQKPLWMES